MSNGHVVSCFVQSSLEDMQNMRAGSPQAIASGSSADPCGSLFLYIPSSYRIAIEAKTGFHVNMVEKQRLSLRELCRTPVESVEDLVDAELLHKLLRSCPH